MGKNSEDSRRSSDDSVGPEHDHEEISEPSQEKKFSTQKVNRLERIPDYRRDIDMTVQINHQVSLQQQAKYKSTLSGYNKTKGSKKEHKCILLAYLNEIGHQVESVLLRINEGSSTIPEMDRVRLLLTELKLNVMREFAQNAPPQQADPYANLNIEISQRLKSEGIYCILDSNPLPNPRDDTTPKIPKK